MGPDLQCTKQAIDNASDTCAYVRVACADSLSFFDFTGFYYCEINQNSTLLILISILFVLLIFSFMGKIADSYLAPSLQVLSQKLRLSEAIAGATLLALGNSAPDVVTGIVVGGKASGSIDIATGGLFGGCLFTVTVILAGCIKGAKQIEVDICGLLRDIGFLLVGITYFMLLTVMNEVTPALACVFFGFYLAYFVFIVFQQRYINKKSQQQKEVHKEDLKETLLEEEKVKEPIRIHVPEISRAPVKKPTKPRRNDFEIFIAKKRMEDLTEEDYRTPIKFQSGYNFGQPNGEVEEKKAKTMSMFSKRDQVSPSNPEFARMTLSPVVIKIKLKEELQKGKKIKPRVRKEEDDAVRPNFRFNSFIEDEHKTLEMSKKKKIPWSKIMKILNVPMGVLCTLTIPPFEREQWSLYPTALTPFFSLLFVLWQLRAIETFNENPYLWAIYGVVALGFSVLILLKGKRENLAARHSGMFALIAFVISMFWLNLITSLIVEYLSLIEVVTGLPLTFISLTILAWGTSLEDLFINTVISKSGYGKMAVVGVYASQIFSLFIGFGAALFRQSLSKTIVFDLYDFTGEESRSNLLILTLLLATFSILLVTLVMTKFSKWVMRSKIMVFLCVFYGAILVTFTAISFAG